MTERKVPTDWAEDRIETLRRMHAAGSDDEQIALALGLQRRVVTDKRCRLGLQPRGEIDPYGASLRRADAHMPRSKLPHRGGPVRRIMLRGWQRT